MVSPGISMCSSQVMEENQRTASLQLSSRLKSCWEKELDWTLFPTMLAQVRMHNKLHGCFDFCDSVKLLTL